MRGQEHWNTPVRLFMHKKMQCLKLQSVPKKGCRGHADNHKLSIFTRETVHSPLLFISQRRWYGDLPSDPPQNKETKANRDQRAQAGNIETPKVEANPSSPKEAPSRNQEAHSKAASPLNEESNASPAGNSHPLFNAYYSARFGKRPTNRMEAEKTKLHTVAPRDGICGKDYSHTSWSALEMLSLAIPSTVVVLAGYWMWRRWFGSDRIEDCTELESMHYLLDSSNPVDYVFIDPEYQVATVYVPVDTLSPDPVATEGDESTEPVRVRKGSFSFHVSDIARLDDTLATLCTPPRRVTYKSGIDLPWHAFIFAALIIPPLILLRFRIIVARGIQSTVPSATRNTSSVGTTNGGNEHPSNRTRPINFRASQLSSGTPGIPGSRSDSGHFKIERGKTQTRFRDIAGMTEPKNEVREVVDFLVSPEKYHRLGATVPKGVLLSGVPGVGKTMLARAVAGEADVKFIYCSGSEFVEIFVGVGAARIRELFRTAHENAPCVIFIDEIDSFAKSRRMGSKQSSEGDSTINALLSEMDGFHPTSGVVVMAGTNRIDVLDDALLRPGRFDRKITIDAPPYADRVDIFALHLNKLKLAVHKADSASLVGALARQLASLTPGCSGADIKNICNEAAIIAAREGRDHVHSVCLQQGLDRVQLGLLRMSAVMSQEDRERAAYHEAGHVVVNWNLERCDPMQKVTILPYSGNKASIHRRLPQERFIRTKEELEERMCDCLGGVAAEELVYAGEMSSASADDLSKATRLGRQMVTVYGMCPEVLGHFSFPDTENAIHKPYSTDTEQEIDEQVSRLVAKARERARTLVRENEVNVRALQGLLLKQETLTAKDIALVLGPKKGMSQEFSRILAA